MTNNQVREIKFRAWDIQNKRMLNNVGFQYSDVGLLIKPEIGMVWGGTEEEQLSHYEGRYGKDHHLMQFTGMYDTKDTPIYEGDIVKTNYYLGTPGKFGELIGEVFYQKPSFRVRQWEYNYQELHGASEVIGNIYENPNLLNQPEEVKG